MGVGRSLSATETGFESAVEAGPGDSVALGLDGTETVANPRAGLEAGFFFLRLFGGIISSQ